MVSILNLRIASGNPIRVLDTRPIISPSMAGDGRRYSAGTHLSRDRCQNRNDGISDLIFKHNLG